jgi:hypothetical protein
MEDKELTGEESLNLIRQMIQTAKTEQKDDGMGWIIWGWMLLLASLFTVINLHTDWFSTFFFWNAFGGVALLYMLFGLARKLFSRKSLKVRTYTGDLFSRLNTGFFISLIFIIFCMNLGARQVSDKLGHFDDTFIRIGYALLVNLYAFWILIYGSALNFRPSVIGAYISWAIAFCILFAQNFEQVMLLHGLAALVGYIIPGHLANKAFRKLKGKENSPAGV